MALPTTFDPLFAKYAGSIPVSYMRALAKRESNLNPRESRDPAWGLMQIVPVARESHNKRHGTNYSKQDLLDPEINVRIGADLLNRIVASYARNHNRGNLRPDWNNPEFVSLVTAGWNSGYSERSGVGRVAHWLRGRGLPVTHANVFRHAREAGGTVHLTNPTKERWQKSVTDLFYSEGGAGPRLGGALGIALAIGGAYVVYRLIQG